MTRRVKERKERFTITFTQIAVCLIGQPKYLGIGIYEHVALPILVLCIIDYQNPLLSLSASLTLRQDAPSGLGEPSQRPKLTAAGTCAEACGSRRLRCRDDRHAGRRAQSRTYSGSLYRLQSVEAEAWHAGAGVEVGDIPLDYQSYQELAR